MVRSEENAVPGYENYLVYCDESGQTGKIYYGLGSLCMPRERRGDFTGRVGQFRAEHGYQHEIKWNRVTRRAADLC